MEDRAAAAEEQEKLKNRVAAFLKDPHSKTERPNGFEMAIGETKDDDTVVMAYVVLPEVPSKAPGAQENVRGTCDQVRARVASELRVFEVRVYAFAIQLR